MAQAGFKPVLKAASLMGMATFLSRLLGLVRELVFAILFGASNVMDAYQVAFRIPNLLRDLFAEGAMSASVVPIFTQVQLEEGSRRAWRIAGLVFRVLLISVSILALAGIYWSPQLVQLYAASFQKIPGKFELTVQMTRWLFLFFPMVVLAAAWMGILNACGVFFMPAFASALFNLTSICVGWIGVQIFSYYTMWGIEPIFGMVFGVLAGGAVQALCQLPALYRVGYQWVARSSSDPPWTQEIRLRQMLWMMLPSTLGLAATQLNLLVNTILATSQGPGAVSWLNYAFRLLQFPIGIFGVSIASATLPQVARQWAQQEVAAVVVTLRQSLRTVFAINLPASVALAVLGGPIIECLFQYGRFSQQDTQATAQALAMYAIGLSAYSAIKVLGPVCYALGNAKLPVISSVLSVGCTLLLNTLMVRFWGYWGLALGTSCAAFLNAGFLMLAVNYLLCQKGGSLPWIALFKGFCVYSFLAVAMGGVSYVSLPGLEILLSQLTESTGFGQGYPVLIRLLRLVCLGIEGGIVFILLAKVAQLHEIFELMNFFRQKLKNKLRRSLTDEPVSH